MRWFAIVLAVCFVSSVASAEPWYRGRYGRNRVVHVSITAAGGVLYPAIGFLEERWAPTSCNWCNPNSIDRGVRSTLRWETGVSTAKTLSDIDGFGLAPAFAIGLVLTGTLRDGWEWARVIDDVTPIVETMVVTEWVTRGMKVSIGRQRPYAHFGLAEGSDDNLSFPSGHTSRAFALVTSAAMIARMRNYAVEPYLWAGGMVIGASTGYLRIAADRHYFTDVLAGAALGIGAGLTVPYLMHRSIEVVPMRGGVTLAGRW